MTTLSELRELYVASGNEQERSEREREFDSFIVQQRGIGVQSCIELLYKLQGSTEQMKTIGVCISMLNSLSHDLRDLSLHGRSEIHMSDYEF